MDNPDESKLTKQLWNSISNQCIVEEWNKKIIKKKIKKTKSTRAKS
jgi:hypothetical protein